MKSLINVQYNVYAPKAERNRTTHLNRVTRSVYPLGSQFKLPRGTSSCHESRCVYSVTWTLRSAVRSSQCETIEFSEEHNKWLSDSLTFKAKQDKHWVQRDQSTHLHGFTVTLIIYCNWKLISFNSTWKKKKKKNLSLFQNLHLSLLPLLACIYLNNAWDLVLLALPLSVCLFKINRFMYSRIVSRFG